MASSTTTTTPSLPPLPTVSLSSATEKDGNLASLSEAFFTTGFCYLTDHGIPTETITSLTSRLSPLFDLPPSSKSRLAKINSPHFVGYDSIGSETTLGEPDWREQFDFGFGTGQCDQHNEEQYWNLLGPNLVPSEEELPGFEVALNEYKLALERTSRSFVALMEEALSMEAGVLQELMLQPGKTQNRIKLVRYPKGDISGLGVGPHKDSSGWLTFLLQTGPPNEADGLEVMLDDKTWLPVPNLPGSFVVNFGNAFEAATEGAVKATIHRVVMMPGRKSARYSVPFFLGLPLDLTVGELRKVIPANVRNKGRERLQQSEKKVVDEFLDERWEKMGDSMLRKWMRSHRDVAERWYPQDTIKWYLTGT